MSGLLRRLTRRRPATADESPSPAAGPAESAVAPEGAPAEPGGDRPLSAGQGSVGEGDAAMTGDRSSGKGDAAAAGDRPPGESDPARAGDRPSGESKATAAGDPPSGEGDAAAAGDRPSGEGDAPTAATAPEGSDQPTQVLPATGETQATSPGAQWATSPTAEQPAEDQPTAFAAQPARSRDLPAGVDPGDLSTAPPASARRGKLRRRLRYLRHVRELLLRDLGGFTYEVHRTVGGDPQEGHRKLSTAKANRIAALDAEVGAIEARLGEPHAAPLLREAGIGGTCPECGELHASDARFCARCGAPLDAKARAQRHAAAVLAAKPAPERAPEAPPASVLWAGGPRPPSEGRAEAEERPGPITSEWLAARDQPTAFEPPPPPEESAPATDEPHAEPVKAPPATDQPAPPVGDDAQAPADQAPAAPDTAGDKPTPADDETPATDNQATGGEQTAASDAPSAATGDPSADADEPIAAGGEPPVTGDEPPADAGPPAKPKRARPKKPAARPEASNGRRDDDVPPPVPRRDPLSREPGS